MRTIAVISAGLSTPSSTRQLADMLSDATVAAITARGESAEVKVIEVRDLARDLADAFTVGGLSSERLDEARRTVASADAVIAVSPVFKASYSGLFKMFVDSLDDDALRSVPTVLGATAGTARHSLAVDHAMRPLFSYMGAMVAPTGIFAATDDFGAATFTGGADGDAGEGAAPLTSRVARAAGELADLVLAQGVGGLASGTTRRSGSGIEEPSGPSFGDLLKGHLG
ncbi:CE1759 family FMN reductase [uncultured Corynebacterium sp.]|uniref:CE1759 family FMN reductase n=1 Tax=uncultured Corynebacterium sp. TaxID=159447 RepID=UPI0025FD0935|nr:CE1759 family FMN reductase [uncultured Corynebacterium sp.]